LRCGREAGLLSRRYLPSASPFVGGSDQVGERVLPNVMT